MTDNLLHWNDYCSKNETDTLYLANADRSRLCIIAEGCGDNLESEDMEEGYVDYFNIEVYDKNEDCFGECGGGFLMMEEYIREKNPSLQEIIRMAREFDDSCFAPEECEILSVEEGEDLLEEFEELAKEQYKNAQDRDL